MEMEAASGPVAAGRCRTIVNRVCEVVRVANRLADVPDGSFVIRLDIPIDNK
jgi:hypothetical protein